MIKKIMFGGGGEREGGRERERERERERGGGQHQHLCLVIDFGQYESGAEAWGQSTVRLAPGGGGGGVGGGLPSSPVALFLHPPISPY